MDFEKLDRLGCQGYGVFRQYPSGPFVGVTLDKTNRIKHRTSEAFPSQEEALAALEKKIDFELG